MAFFAIGVDLGGTNLRIAAVDEQGTLLEKLTTGTQVQRGREHVIGEMTDAIKSLVLKFKDKGDLVGIGIGVPGFIDMDHGIIRESPNLPGWAEFPVRDDIERRLGTKVFLENDANSAAMGEKWLGAGRDYDDMCMLTLGTGVGGGLVLNGRLWQGMKGMAGELGHTTAFPDGLRCPCGNSGCVELYASATGVMRMAREAIANGTAPELEAASRGNVEFSSKIIYQLAIQGDKSAQGIYNTVGKALGILL